MSFKDERKANLLRASAMTRVQDAQIQNALSGMSNEEVENFIGMNPDVAEMLAVGADNSNNDIVVNYSTQPDKQQNITIDLPWEADFSAAGQTQGRVNLFQVGSNPSTGMSFGGFNNGFGFNSNPNDERLKKYTPGMKLYNINPYNFVNADQMINYYNYLEEQRKHNQNQYYGWALLAARTTGTSEMMEWAESFKFKTADQIYEEQQEARVKAEQERAKALQEEGNNVVYDVYDCNGVRLERVHDFKIKDKETGEIIREVKHQKDALGQSYKAHTQIEDRQKEYELQQFYGQIANFNRYIETFTRLFNKQYTDNINRWARWEAEGLSKEEQWARFEDERIDWKKHERALDRALKSAAYSRDTFKDILSSCCHTELDYANRSDFFSLSYDFERDLHYKSLISTPEEMNNDPLVHQKLQQEYEIKRKLFMDKVNSGNLGCQTATDAHYHPTFAKTPIHELTLEDYQKPENQFMYTKTVTPQLSTENMFIPNDIGNMTQEKLAQMGVYLDANGQIVPQQRTIGIMTVDDDTGEIISQHEFNPDEFDTGPGSGAKVSGLLSDEELANFF